MVSSEFVKFNPVTYSPVFIQDKLGVKAYLDALRSNRSQSELTSMVVEAEYDEVFFTSGEWFGEALSSLKVSL